LLSDRGSLLLRLFSWLVLIRSLRLGLRGRLLTAALVIVPGSPSPANVNKANEGHCNCESYFHGGVDVEDQAGKEKDVETAPSDPLEEAEVLGDSFDLELRGDQDGVEKDEVEGQHVEEGVLRLAEFEAAHHDGDNDQGCRGQIEEEKHFGTHVALQSVYKSHQGI